MIKIKSMYQDIGVHITNKKYTKQFSDQLINIKVEKTYISIVLGNFSMITASTKNLLHRTHTPKQKGREGQHAHANWGFVHGGH